ADFQTVSPIPASATPTRRTTIPKRTTPARNGPCPIGFRGFTEIRLVVCNTAGRGFREKGKGFFRPRGGKVCGLVGLGSTGFRQGGAEMFCQILGDLPRDPFHDHEV